jgi:predicted metal-binding protein
MLALDYVQSIGIDTLMEFNPGIMIPQENMRTFCIENKCGNYDNNYMCPPHIGTITDMKHRLEKYIHGILLQDTVKIADKDDHDYVRHTKLDFHHKVLQIEEFLKNKGTGELWSMIAGSCSLCDNCQAIVKQPCTYPDKARMSMEAAGINVLDVLAQLGLDNKFYEDKVNWTGCILCADSSMSLIIHDINEQ